MSITEVSTMQLKNILMSFALMVGSSIAFTTSSTKISPVTKKDLSSTYAPAFTQAVIKPPTQNTKKTKFTQTTLEASPDLEVVALVAGQENYGLAIVAMGEAIWSFLEAPSLDHAKVLAPATLAAIILVAVSGPMVTNSADVESIKLGLEIATGVSIMLGASYVARLLAPYSPSAKEIAFGGLLVAIAGFFSFSQNLVVDEFVQLPSIPLPDLGSIFPENDF